MNIIKDMGEGLVLRRATPDDAEEVAVFNSLMHLGYGVTEPEETLGQWTRDLMSGAHPTTSASDVLVVEDTRTQKIVSTSSLISQVWSYGGIPFKLGRPELVATHPDYRNRGLVRAQFGVLHDWSRERGEIAQAITGIFYYYRQFGYEMTLHIPSRRAGYRPHIPALEEGAAEPFNIRPATDSDIPFFIRLYDKARKRYFITVPRDETIWRYEFNRVSPTSEMSNQFRIIETPEGTPAGVLQHWSRVSRGALGATLLEIVPGVSWAAVAPTVLRYMGKYADDYVKQIGQGTFDAFVLQLGESHPVYEVLRTRLPRKSPTYPYYMRVPDMPAFINHVAPALERRLPGSGFEGHTGELKINFYRSAFKIVFNSGKITAETYAPIHQDDGDIFFPNLTFLHVLFGYLDLEDIERVFADCWSPNDEGRALVKTLFPKQDSFVPAIS